MESPPDDLYIENEKEKIIKDKIHSLKEPYLKVSVMYFLEEKNVDEISRLLERPKKTVQTQIIRAKGLLQNLLKEEYKHERAF
jgi:RNA polymerase sigma-70 factor (ECF subfamily)